MIDAMNNGISGLNVFETALNTETNNISNVNTVGYKSDKISFADQMYQKSIGTGVNIAVIDKLDDILIEQKLKNQQLANKDINSEIDKLLNSLKEYGG